MFKKKKEGIGMNEQQKRVIETIEEAENILEPMKERALAEGDNETYELMSKALYDLRVAKKEAYFTEISFWKIYWQLFEVSKGMAPLTVGEYAERLSGEVKLTFIEDAMIPGRYMKEALEDWFNGVEYPKDTKYALLESRQMYREALVIMQTYGFLEEKQSKVTYDHIQNHLDIIKELIEIFSHSKELDKPNKDDNNPGMHKWRRRHHRFDTAVRAGDLDAFSLTNQELKKKYPAD